MQASFTRRLSRSASRKVVISPKLREERLKRNMKRFRGVARIAGVMILIHRDTKFKLKLFGNNRRISEDPISTKHDKKKNMCQRIYSGLNRLVMLPSSRIKRGWDVLLLVVIFWITWRIPFVIAFGTAGDPDFVLVCIGSVQYLLLTILLAG